MGDNGQIIRDAQLVKEQVERASNEGSVGSLITEARVAKWFEDKHGKKWTEVLNGNHRPVCGAAR